MQPCVLTGAIDALLGPTGQDFVLKMQKSAANPHSFVLKSGAARSETGVLTAAMERDVAHWRQEKNCCRGWDLSTQVRKIDSHRPTTLQTIVKRSSKQHKQH